jgi:hypothetical protein
MATSPDQVASDRNITGQQAALVVGLLVALLIVMWFLFLRGSSPEPLTATPPVTTPTEAEPEETAEPTKPGKGPLETFEVFAPKDPFKPLISQTTGSNAAPAAPTTDTSGTDTGTDTGSAPSGGSDIDSGGSSDNNVGGHRVRLIDTFRAGGEARARIQVDGTVYTVSEGDRFADNFQLVSVNGDCASILFGDDQFSLCEGEEILK